MSWRVWQSAVVNRAKRPHSRSLSAGRRPARRTGVIVLALLFASVGGALYLAHHYHLGVAPTGVAVLVGGGAPAALYLAWASYRDAAGGGGLSLAEVADQLAVAVGAQWTAEAAARRLNIPYPLPVSWGAADASLTDGWDVLVKLAASGAGWPRPLPASTWAAGPDDLVGDGGQLADVLTRVPTGRLVVLGEPGAGKTMLMVRLVLDLLARRAAGGPVPLLVSAASWDPVGQDLRSWLVAQLLIEYPALAAPPPTDRTESTRAAALLASGLIVLVLDGLDEIPEQLRGPAINRINNALGAGEQVVVTCRTQQYRDAVRPQGGAEVILRGAAAVQLRPLYPDAVRGYLCDDAAGPVTKARWDPVFAVLGTEAPAGQALRTPLMVGLARTIYNPRPGGTLREPVELCSPALADRAAVESLLFDAFIPAAYQDDPAGRWKAQDMERWLVFLARHLEYTIVSPDLAWWQLPRAVPGLTLAAKAAAGMLYGVAFGAMAGVVAGHVLGGRAGLVTWVVVWVVIAGIRAARRESPRPVGVRLQLPSRGNVMIGVMAGVVAGVALGSVAWAAVALAAGAAVALVVGVVVGVVAGVVAAVVVEGIAQWNTPLDLSSAASPSAVLAGDRRTGAALGVALGVALGSVTWAAVAAGIYPGPVAGAAVGVGVAVGGIASFAFSAWPSYGIARIWLALCRRLPWQLMDFLADAHKRGVLRQAGAVYQFRHIKLQRRLATRP